MEIFGQFHPAFSFSRPIWFGWTHSVPHARCHKILKRAKNNLIRRRQLGKMLRVEEEV
jgi:hypothetical protein